MNGISDSKFADSERRAILASSTVLLWLILASTILLYSSGKDLPLGFFALMTVGSAVIVVSILVVPTFSKTFVRAVLLQLLTLWIFSRVAEAYQFPSILGGDTYAHLASVQSLQSTGQLSLTAQDSTAFPAFHIMLLDLIQIGGLDPKLGFVTVSLSSALTIGLFYIIAKHFLEPRWAALATTLLTTLPYFTFWTLTGISPTTIAIVLALVTIAALYKELDRPSVGCRILSLVAGAALVIAHPILTLFVVWMLISVLGVHWAVRFLRKDKHKLSASFANGSVLISVMMLAYWMYLSRVWAISVGLVDSILTASGDIFPKRELIASTLEVRLWIDLPYILLGLGSILSGIRWLVGAAVAPVKAAWSVASLGVALVAGFSIFSGADIGAFANRWLLLLELVGAVLIAESLRHALATKKRGNKTIALALVVVIGFVGLTSPLASLNQSGYSPRLAFTNEELNGLAFARLCNNPIVSDSYAGTYLHWLLGRETADLYGLAIGIPRTFGAACVVVRGNSHVVWTRTSLETTQLSLGSSDLAPGLAVLPPGYLRSLDSRADLAKLYDNGDVRWYGLGLI